MFKIGQILLNLPMSPFGNLTPFLTALGIYMDRVKRIWYLSHMQAAKVQASLRIRAVSPEPPLLAHTSNESRGTFRQKARSLASLNGWACAVKICHDGMLEDTNSLDAAHIYYYSSKKLILLLEKLLDHHCYGLTERFYRHKCYKCIVGERLLMTYVKE